MLSEQDRLLLAPHLALVRNARRDLAAAERAVAAAEKASAASTVGTDWRDRLLGGLFSADDKRTQHYRRAQGARKAAEKALDDARKRYETYAVRVDGLLEPMLLRDDPGYRAQVDAVRVCDRALKAGGEMRFRIVSALAKPPKSATSESWHEAEFGRARLAELITALREEEPRLRRLVERATGKAAELDTTGLRRPGPGADQALRQLQLQVEAAVKQVADRRAQVEQERVAALRAAHDAL